MLDLMEMDGDKIKTDGEIVIQSLNDSAHFSILIDRYEEKLTRYIRRLCDCSKEDIEDLLQEIFIKIYKNLNDFDQSLKFSSWAYRITHNEVISRFRRIKSHPQGADISEYEIKGNSPDTILLLDQKLDGRKIAEILKEMDIKYREVLVLRFFEEKDYAEISDILQKPAGTVATLLNRAKYQFRNIAKQLNINFK